MLKEVELVVLGFNIEVWTIDFNRTGRACAKWRVGKDDIHQGGRFFLQRVLAYDRAVVCAYTMKIKVHGGKCNHKWGDIIAM